MMRPASFVATSISVASMRPLLWAKPSGRSVRVSFHQAKKPALAPRSTTAAAISHFLSFLVRWGPVPPPRGVDAGLGAATLFAASSLTEGCWRAFACGSCDWVLMFVSLFCWLLVLHSPCVEEGLSHLAVHGSGGPFSGKRHFIVWRRARVASSSRPRRRPSLGAGLAVVIGTQEQCNYRAQEVRAEFSAAVVDRKNAQRRFPAVARAGRGVGGYWHRAARCPGAVPGAGELLTW